MENQVTNKEVGELVGGLLMFVDKSGAMIVSKKYFIIQNIIVGATMGYGIIKIGKIIGTKLQNRKDKKIKREHEKLDSKKLDSKNPNK